MINLALRTEYSFQKTYGFIRKVIETQGEIVGIADINNTFSHFYLNEICEELGKKPIFGVRLMVVEQPEERTPPRGQFGPEYIFIAKNYEGLKEIYKLVERSIECFYYRAHIGIVDVWRISENIIVIAPDFTMDERIDYVGVCNITTKRALNSSVPKVAINNNWYTTPEDRMVYELFAGARKTEKFTFPQHILSEKEWLFHYEDEQAVKNTYAISEMCNVDFPVAEPVKYSGKNKIRTLCRVGAKKLKVNLKDKEYKERLKRELDLIKDKDFTDYFLIVADMISKAKETMLVGPGRGSSGGSLVCFLLGITTLDPIKWDLLFDRFIDVNRHDMPDIDIDFPDTKRQSVIKELVKTNGRNNVKAIATVSVMKSKSAIGDFAKGLGIEPEEVEGIKNSIISVSSGDARYGKAIESTFNETEIGKRFIEKHPDMELVKGIENHARHTGKHAAGVLVATRPLSEFGSININDNTVQIEGKSAERMNLLKIDCLGITTLSILEEISELAGFSLKEYYELTYDDDETFKLFREVKVKGIFQFEGNALAGLCRTIKVRDIEDIVAITSLARPGPLHGGGAAKFSKVHQGLEEMELIMDDPDVRAITEKTMGVIIYQEQVMKIMRQVGGFPWERVSEMRKIISKKKGKEYMEDFKNRFIEGATKKNIKKEDSESAWKKILEFAQYGFNRSHAVAYGMVSYWTAWAKCHYPMEFLIANLNANGDVANKKRLIREMKISHEFNIVAYDKDLSNDKWYFMEKGKKIIGPLTNINGVGVKNAQVVMRKRLSGEVMAKGIAAKLESGETVYDIIYPCEYYWGGMFRSPKRYGLYTKPTVIKKVNKKGEYLIIAQLMKKNVRDLNELQNVMKRGGEIYTENTKLLNITVEDDTGSLMCRVSRYEYDKLGAIVAEEGEEETDWYLIRGKIISDDIIFLFISEIHKLGDGKSDGQTIRDI